MRNNYKNPFCFKEMIVDGIQFFQNFVSWKKLSIYCKEMSSNRYCLRNFKHIDSFLSSFSVTKLLYIVIYISLFCITNKHNDTFKDIKMCSIYRIEILFILLLFLKSYFPERVNCSRI